MILLKYVANFLFQSLVAFSLFYLSQAIPQFAFIFYLILAAVLLASGFIAKSKLQNKAIVEFFGLVFGVVTAISMFWV